MRRLRLRFGDRAESHFPPLWHRTHRLLSASWPEVEEIANALLKKKVLTGIQIEEVLQGIVSAKPMVGRSSHAEGVPPVTVKYARSA